VSANDKKYWRSLQEYEEGAPSEARAPVEFAGTPLREASEPRRREFLQAAGFVFASAAFSGCGCAGGASDPLLRQPEGMRRPSVLLCRVCVGAVHLAECCEVPRRPAHQFGANPGTPCRGGGLCAVGKLDLGLYDSLRLQQLWWPDKRSGSR